MPNPGDQSRMAELRHFPQNQYKVTMDKNFKDKPVTMGNSSESNITAKYKI